MCMYYMIIYITIYVYIYICCVILYNWQIGISQFCGCHLGDTSTFQPTPRSEYKALWDSGSTIAPCAPFHKLHEVSHCDIPWM